MPRFDPIWVGKVVPRRITPMMTSLFYDLPKLRWLMKNVVGAIRVQASTYRREAPELRQAITELDRGECVVIFPEGWCRRSEDRPLRRFGQGVWHILHERPQTPVVALWIEGGWGTWSSFAKGRPFKGLPDFRHRIDIGVTAPVVLDSETLADQHKTREVLRRMVLDARRHLGLPPLE